MIIIALSAAPLTHIPRISPLNTEDSRLLVVALQLFV